MSIRCFGVCLVCYKRSIEVETIERRRQSSNKNNRQIIMINTTEKKNIQNRFDSIGLEIDAYTIHHQQQNNHSFICLWQYHGTLLGDKMFTLRVNHKTNCITFYSIHINKRRKDIRRESIGLNYISNAYKKHVVADPSKSLFFMYANKFSFILSSAISFLV